MDQIKETYGFSWRGITVRVSYSLDWLNLSDPAMEVAHLEVNSINPDRAPLPFTETGYKSHFIHPNEIEHAGGPEAYARAWLDHAAQSPAWIKKEEAAKQLSLF